MLVIPTLSDIERGLRELWHTSEDQGEFMMQYWSRLRQPALFAAGLSILLLLMLVTACGSGNGDDGDTAPAATVAPAATPAPAATTTPAAPAETPDDSQMSGPSTGSEELFIIANTSEEIPISLATGDVLDVKFDVKSNITGGQNVTAGIGQADQGIQVVIHDPFGESLFTINDTTESDSMTVTAESSGEHLIIFFNPFPLQAVTVDVIWAVNP